MSLTGVNILYTLCLLVAILSSFFCFIGSYSCLPENCYLFPVIFVYFFRYSYWKYCYMSRISMTCTVKEEITFEWHFKSITVSLCIIVSLAEQTWCGVVFHGTSTIQLVNLYFIVMFSIQYKRTQDQGILWKGFPRYQKDKRRQRTNYKVIFVATTWLSYTKKLNLMLHLMR